MRIKRIHDKQFPWFIEFGNGEEQRFTEKAFIELYGLMKTSINNVNELQDMRNDG